MSALFSSPQVLLDLCTVGMRGRLSSVLSDQNFSHTLVFRYGVISYCDFPPIVSVFCFRVVYVPCVFFSLVSEVPTFQEKTKALLGNLMDEGGYLQSVSVSVFSTFFIWHPVHLEVCLMIVVTTTLYWELIVILAVIRVVSWFWIWTLVKQHIQYLFFIFVLCYSA